MSHTEKGVINYVNNTLEFNVSESLFNALALASKIFGVAKRTIIPSLGSTYLYFDPTAYTGEELILLPLEFEAFGAGPIEIDLYQDPTVTPTGAITPINRDLTNTDPCQIAVSLQTSVTAEGTQLPPEWTIFSDGVAAVAVAGGSFKESIIIKVDTTKTYLLKLTNTDTVDPANVQISMNWAEL
jgi:hypothetical protein